MLTKIILAIALYTMAKIAVAVVEKIMGCENITSAGPNTFGKC